MKKFAKLGGIMWNWITHRVNHPLWRAACLIGAFLIFGFIPIYIEHKYYSTPFPAVIGYTVIFAGCVLVVIWFLQAIVRMIADWIKKGDVSLIKETIKATSDNLIKAMLDKSVQRITTYSKKCPSDELCAIVCKNYGFEVFYERFLALDENSEGLEPGYWEKVIFERRA
jgi:hypothetical protein